MRVVSGIEVTTVSTTAQFPVGGKFSVASPAGSTQDQEWIYVKSSTGLTVVGTLVSRAAGSGTCDACVATPTSDSTLRVIGVVQHAIADGSYGFVQCKGIGTVLIDTGVSANAGLQVGNGTAGRADALTAAITGMGMGFSLAVIGTGETGQAWINCPGA